MRLVTKRLILRDCTQEDAKDIVENLNNLNVSKWLLVVPYPYTMKDAKWWINHCKEQQKQKPRTNYDFSIVLKKENKVIGGIGLSNVDRFQGIASIGYWIGEDYWRQGIAKESLKEILDFAFYKLKKYELANKHLKIAEQSGVEIDKQLLRAIKRKLR